MDTRRRGCSVSCSPLSRTNFATTESEMEQDGNLWMKSKNKDNLSATSGNGQNGLLSTPAISAVIRERVGVDGSKARPGTPQDSGISL